MHMLKVDQKVEGDQYIASPPTQKLGGLVRLRNDLYCVEWGVKLYSLTLGGLVSPGPRGCCTYNLGQC